MIFQENENEQLQIVKKITKQKKNYLITTTDDEFEVDENTLVKFRLIVNKQLSNEEILEIKNLSNANKALNIGLNFLSYQFRSTKEVINYLKQKGISEENIDYVVFKLNELHYLDDYSFAVNLQTSYINKAKGPKYIIQKLQEKGIETNIINEVISLYKYEDQLTIIKEKVQKHLVKKSDVPINKSKQMIISKLINDGFDYSIIYQVINETKFIDNSFQMLEKDLQKISKRIDEKYRDKTNQERKMKIITSLIQKGYLYEDIIKKL